MCPGAAIVEVVEAGLSLHEAFKCTAAAGSKIYTLPSFSKNKCKASAFFFRTPFAWSDGLYAIRDTVLDDFPKIYRERKK